MTTRNIMLYHSMLRHMGNDLVCIKGIWYFFMAKQFSFGRAMLRHIRSVDIGSFLIHRKIDYKMLNTFKDPYVYNQRRSFCGTRIVFIRGIIKYCIQIILECKTSQTFNGN